MAERIPKAEELLQAAAQFMVVTSQKDPASTRALWVILNAADRLALRCATEDGDREAVEREGEKLSRMLSKVAGTEEIIAEERRAAREKLS